jgi:NADH:ubiquinone oxidoreductase subunit 2 (subunit N)
MSLISAVYYKKFIINVCFVACKMGERGSDEEEEEEEEVVVVVVVVVV